MQAKLRLLDADERRGPRVTENGEQAEIAEGAIGQPRGGYRDVAFLEKYLDGAACDGQSVVIYAFVEFAQCFQQPTLRLGVEFQAIQNQSEVRSILCQKIVGEIRFLRQTGGRQPTERPFPEKTDSLELFCCVGQLRKVGSSDLREDRLVGANILCPHSYLFVRRSQVHEIHMCHLSVSTEV